MITDKEFEEMQEKIKSYLAKDDLFILIINIKADNLGSAISNTSKETQIALANHFVRSIATSL